MADSPEGLTVIFPVATGGDPAALPPALNSWLHVLDHVERPYEVLLVLDGATDAWRAAADTVAAGNPRVKVLALDHPTGYGAGVRLGLVEATQPLIFYSALDGGWNPGDLPRMLAAIDFKDEYTDRTVELVNGHRRGLPEPGGRTLRRKAFNVFIRVVYGMWPDAPKGYLGPAESRYWYRARLQFGLRLGDVNSRFKLFRRSVFDRLVIQSDGEFVHTEILAKANFLGTLMDEMVLTDKCVPGALPDMSADRRVVFNHPKFHSPVQTPDNQPPMPSLEAAMPAV